MFKFSFKAAQGESVKTAVYVIHATINFYWWSFSLLPSSAFCTYKATRNKTIILYYLNKLDCCHRIIDYDALHNTLFLNMTLRQQQFMWSHLTEYLLTACLSAYRQRIAEINWHRQGWMGNFIPKHYHLRELRHPLSCDSSGRIKVSAFLLNVIRRLMDTVSLARLLEQMSSKSH